MNFLDKIKNTTPIQVIGNIKLQERNLFNLYDFPKKIILSSLCLISLMAGASNNALAGENFLNSAFPKVPQAETTEEIQREIPNWLEEVNVSLEEEKIITTPYFSGNPGVEVPSEEWSFHGFDKEKFIEFLEDKNFNFEEAFLYYQLLSTFSNPRMNSDASIEYPEKIGIEFRREVTERLLSINSKGDLVRQTRWIFNEFSKKIRNINDYNCLNTERLSINHPCYMFLNSLGRFDRVASFLYLTELEKHKNSEENNQKIDYYDIALNKYGRTHVKDTNGKILHFDSRNFTLRDGMTAYFNWEESRINGQNSYNQDSYSRLNNNYQNVSYHDLKEQWNNVLVETQLNSLELPLISSANLGVQYSMLNELTRFSNQLETITTWDDGVLGFKGRLNLFYGIDRPIYDTEGFYGIFFPMAGVRGTIVSDRDALLHEWLHFIEFSSLYSVNENPLFNEMVDMTKKINEELTTTGRTISNEQAKERLLLLFEKEGVSNDMLEQSEKILDLKDFNQFVADLVNRFSESEGEQRGNVYGMIYYLGIIHKEKLNFSNEEGKTNNNLNAYANQLVFLEKIKSNLEDGGIDIPVNYQADYEYINSGEEVRARSIGVADFSFLGIDRNFMQPKTLGIEYFSPVGEDRVIHGRIFHENFKNLRSWWDSVPSTIFFNNKNNIDFKARLNLLRNSENQQNETIYVLKR